jgi:hypothetical protein
MENNYETLPIPQIEIGQPGPSQLGIDKVAANNINVCFFSHFLLAT